jgi:hypothetical protein
MAGRRHSDKPGWPLQIWRKTCGTLKPLRSQAWGFWGLSAQGKRKLYQPTNRPVHFPPHRR